MAVRSALHAGLHMLIFCSQYLIRRIFQLSTPLVQRKAEHVECFSKLPDSCLWPVNMNAAWSDTLNCNYPSIPFENSMGITNDWIYPVYWHCMYILLVCWQSLPTSWQLCVYVINAYSFWTSPQLRIYHEHWNSRSKRLQRTSHFHLYFFFAWTSWNLFLTSSAMWCGVVRHKSLISMGCTVSIFRVKQ
jgi:hypothetical protein